MTIRQGDIKLMQSQRMTDNEDGGGRITGNEVEDGKSNGIFDDVSDLDRAYGRTSLRRVFPAVLTDTTDQYFGSHVIIDQIPSDPNVSVLAFQAGGPAATRDVARERVESYVTMGPLSRMRLLGDQMEGQRSIQVWQRPEAPLPEVGDVFALSTESGDAAGQLQFVRVNEIDHEIRAFEYLVGSSIATFDRRVITLGLSTTLRHRMYGMQPAVTTSQPDTVIREGQYADASRYYGVTRLANPASLGDREIQVEDTFSPIVPSTTVEDPVLDVQAGGGVTISLQSGGYTYEVAQVASTHLTQIELNNRGYNYVASLSPLPAPGSLAISYRSQGKWYTLRDEDGTGDITGQGAGRVDYTTGSVSVTLKGLPDVGTAILYSWGTPVHYVDRAGIQTLDTPTMNFDFEDYGVVPGTVTVSWLTGGQTRTATDDGTGNLSGDATGRVVYGYVDADGNDEYGSLYVKFNGANFPDANSTVQVDYSYAGQERSLFNPTADSAGFITLQLPNPPIKPGSVTVSWKVTRTTHTEHVDYQWGGPAIQSQQASGSENVINYAIGDDAAGGFGEWDGSIDYASGQVTFMAEPLHTYQRWEGGDSISELNDWRENEVKDVFGDGSAVYAGYQPDSATPTTSTIEHNLQPLTVDMMPRLQDSVIPDTLRFRFKGDTYIDRQGALYRSIDSQGAGLYAGSINYDTGVATIETWPQNTADATNVSVDSLVSTYGTWTFSRAFLRTPGSPIQPGGFTIRASTLDGRNLSGQGQFDGTITGDELEGTINYETGVVELRFGQLVDDASLTAEEKDEPWYDPANVDANGQIWQPTPVIPSTARFNAVVLTSLPLDADLLGLDPVRLPPDGRVQAYRPGDIVVVHETETKAWPTGVATGDTLSVGRTRLAFIRVEDANGATVDGTLFDADLDAGTITITGSPDTTTNPEPWTAYHRIEDMLLVGDVEVSGRMTLKGQLSHDYPADQTLVSSALIAGDLRARVKNLFDQTTWTGEWSESLIGDEPTAEYNDTTYPLEVTNRGAITERWALIFTGNTSFRIIGETVGEIGTGTINEDTAPLNPNNGVPYWTIKAGGWGNGWSAGNVLRFDTEGANFPVWLARTVLPGDATGDSDVFRLQIRGNVNA